jgi:hypothetical protein
MDVLRENKAGHMSLGGGGVLGAAHSSSFLNYKWYLISDELASILASA